MKAAVVSPVRIAYVGEGHVSVIKGCTNTVAIVSL